eukprot:jgi/Ulvmu1/12368/UM009_0014.1
MRISTFAHGRTGALLNRRRGSTRAQATKDPRAGNVDGQFFVDHTCIDCDTCRWMAPDSFARVGNGSAVVKQPDTRDGRIAAMQATLSCPTFSIHMRSRDKEELQEARDGMPIPVPDCPGVYHLGFHSEKSFGATSYIIVRPEGNVMMDTPRFNPLLAKSLEALGGVNTIVLSHIDDLGDHDLWAKHFGAQRVMHNTEIKRSIADIEVQLSGTGPWDLSGQAISPDALDGGLQIVHVPGHTSGSIALWHAPAKAMFTGDHLGWSERFGGPSIFPRYNRDGIAKQVESVEKMLEFDFLHVLPGHGRRFSVKDATERLKLVAQVKKDFAGAAAAY